MDVSVNQIALERIREGLSGLLLVTENEEAFAARLLSARSATQTLDLMYYLWRDDACGRALMGEVLDAADRGVKVRLLIDDINPQRDDTAYLRLDSHPNIALKLFNPSRKRNGSPLRLVEMALRLMAMTRRMHCKAWIADGRYAIVGGRNIGDAYFDAADTNFRDLDLLMMGPVVEQTKAIFEEYWSHTASTPIRALHDRRRWRRFRKPKPDRRLDLDAILKGRSTLDEFIAARGDMHWVRDARMMADPAEKVRGRRRRNWLMQQLVPTIETARQSLEIVSPYFIPGRRGTKILKGLVRDGADVTVLTNSLAATDVAAVHGGYANYRRKLLKGGVKLYELQPFGDPKRLSVFGSKGASLHTKAFCVDGRTGFIGSLNFDPRSASLNAEMGVLFEDEGLAGELLQCFEREKSPQTSYRVFLERGELRWEAAYPDGVQQFAWEPEASVGRRLLATLVRILPVESQL